MWQWLAECLLYLVNLITICGLSWHAFKQSEQIKDLTAKLADADDQISALESECNHQAGLAWNRLSESEKDAAIRMG